MNKEEIITYLKKYNFDNKNYIVISGAAMVLLGIKEKTNDIDISVTKEYYNYLLNNYDCLFETKDINNDNVYFIDKINFGKCYFSDNIEYIDDIPVQKVSEIKKLKKFLNRDKDKIDLKLIDDFIGDNYE